MKIHYFPLYGRAEAIRFLLSAAKVDFENVDYTFEEWGKIKDSGKFEFNQLPALENEGKVLTQSVSILRSLAIKHGYYSSDPQTCWLIDSAIDSVSDIISPL